MFRVAIFNLLHWFDGKCTLLTTLTQPPLALKKKVQTATFHTAPFSSEGLPGGVEGGGGGGGGGGGVHRLSH